MKRTGFKFKNRIAVAIFLMLSAISVQAKDSMDLEQAAEHARKSSKGKVLSARTTNRRGENTHRIQVLTPSGRVKIYNIPAKEANNSRHPQIGSQRYSSRPSPSTDKPNYRQTERKPSRDFKPSSSQRSSSRLNSNSRTNNTSRSSSRIRPNSSGNYRSTPQRAPTPVSRQPSSEGNKDK